MPKKTILITGGNGFIGSHLCEFFVEKDYKVFSFDRYNSNYNLNCLEDSVYKKEIEFIFGDIRDYDSVNKAVKNCDTILHLAALIGIPYSYISPNAYIKTNVEGTYNILESAKNKRIKQTIITSTSEVYGSARYTPMDEAHPIQSQSPYAASKISADQMAISYWNSFRLPVKIIRPFNNFGPRQSQRAVIPTIINQTLNNEFLKLGNLSPKRDYTFVKDTASAYYHILKNKIFFGKVVNVGSGKTHSISSIAKDVQKILKTNKKIKLDKNRVRIKSSEVDLLKCNCNFLKKNTKWKISKTFSNHLKDTINWSKKYSNKSISKIYSV